VISSLGSRQRTGVVAVAKNRGEIDEKIYMRRFTAHE
jgi:hypothetical protein